MVKINKLESFPQSLFDGQDRQNKTAQKATIKIAFFRIKMTLSKSDSDDILTEKKDIKGEHHGKNYKR